MDAMGVPSSLHRSNGGALRESYRHFFNSTVETLGALISAELSEKLERTIRLDFPQASKSDISARSRAFRSLVDAGMKPKDAARIAGLPTDFEIDEPPAPAGVPATGPPTPGGSDASARLFRDFVDQLTEALEARE